MASADTPTTTVATAVATSSSNGGGGGNGGGNGGGGGGGGWFGGGKKKESSRKRREAEDKRKKEAKEKENSLVKQFLFDMSDIEAQFEKKMDNVFIEIVLGGYDKEVDAEVVQKTIKRKRKGPEGEETEVAVQVTDVRKKIQVLRPSAARFFTRAKTNIKVRESVRWQNQSFEGYWTGSYADLEVETLDVYVWHSRTFGPNDLVGSASEVLVDIANSKVERELHIKSLNEGGRVTIAAVVRLKCIFQETFNFQIDFVDWEAQLNLHNESDADSSEDEEATHGAAAEARIAAMEKKAARDRRRRHHHLVKFHVSNPVGLWTRLWEGFGQCRWIKHTSTKLHLINGFSGGNRGSVNYQGTRAQLEDEELEIRVYKRRMKTMWILLAEKNVALQGTLDHGFVMAHLDYLQFLDPNTQAKVRAMKCGSCFACLSCLPCFRATLAHKVNDPDATDEASGKMIVKGVVNAVQEPRYRQSGNVGRRKTDKLLSFGGGDVYLVVKVIRAKGLQSLDEFKEQLNPLVVVEWASVRKSTRPMLGNADPFWDEDMYFKVPDVHKSPPEYLEDFGSVAKRSELVLSIWDTDDLSVAPLGHCSVNFSTVYQFRTQKKVYSRRTGRETKQWVFESKNELTIPDIRMKESDYHTKDLLKPHEDQQAQALHRYIEFLVYFDHEGGHKIERPKFSKAEDREEDRKDPNNPYNITERQLFDPTPMSLPAQKRAQAFWEESLRMVLEKDKRFFVLLGKDEWNGGVHFLPQFVKPIHPPTEIQSLDKLFYFIYCLEHQQKPLPDLTEVKPDSLFRLIPNVWSWAHPFVFLEKKKGDVKDHALLLACFLLGLNFDAWVCVGRARAKPGSYLKSSDDAVPHVWVMTRHNHDEEVEMKQRAALDVKTTKLRDELRALTAAEEEAKENGDAKKLKVASKQRLRAQQALQRLQAGVSGGANARPYVRFWEVVNNRCYSLRGAYLFQPDKKSAKRGTGGMSAAMAAVDGGDTGGGDDIRNGMPMPTTTTTTTLDGDAVGDDADANADADDDDAAASAAAAAAAVAASRKSGPDMSTGLEFEDGELDLADLDDALLEQAVKPAKISADIGSSASQNVADMLRLNRVAERREVLAQQRTRQEKIKLDDTVTAKAPSTPYLTLDVAFNHQRLYANIQAPNPEEIKYDFSNTARWVEFPKKNWKEFIHTRRVTPLYPDKPLHSVPAQEAEIEALRDEILERIRGTLRSFREYEYHVSTEFYDEFPYPSGAKDATEEIQKRLSLEERAPKNMELMEAIDDDHDHIFREEMDDDMTTESINAERRRWRKKVLEMIDRRNQKYVEKILHFKHTDGNRISDTVLEMCKDDKPNILSFTTAQTPVYTCGVKIERLPSLVSPVRVFLACTYTDV